MLATNGLQKQKNGCAEQKKCKKKLELLEQELFLTANYANYSNADAVIFFNGKLCELRE